MRRRRHHHTKLAVCKPYDRLRKRWQSLVDETTVQSDSKPLDEDTAMSAQQKMLEHRASCDVCKQEDLALKEGDLPRQVEAGII
jgi:hypothetical protein